MADQPSADARAAASAARRAAAVAAGVQLPDQASFRAWLHEHADTADGIWLRMAKKGAGVTTIVHREALDEALCFGWIDAQVYADDDPRFTLRRFMPRRPRSTWSQINRTRVEELTEAGLMTPRGQLEIDRAIADGRMAAAYQPSSDRTVPPELQAALEARPGAVVAFEALTSQNRYAFVHRIVTAKRPETRERLAAQFAEQLLRGELPHP